MATYEGTEAMRIAFPQPRDILDKQSVKGELDKPTMSQEILASRDADPSRTFGPATFIRGAARRDPAMQPI